MQKVQKDMNKSTKRERERERETENIWKRKFISKRKYLETKIYLENLFGKYLFEYLETIEIINTNLLQFFHISLCSRDI